MSLQNFAIKFDLLKKQGIDLEYVLDIGAYKGEFTKLVKTKFPHSIIEMFEPNLDNKSFLETIAKSFTNVKYHDTLLSNLEKEVSFYSISETNGLVSTGSSIYLEKTVFYNNPIVTIKKTSTLDDWYVGDAGSIRTYPWHHSGMLKLDVQGSELDILKGGIHFLEECRPRFYLLEVSVQEYNKGAPLIGDVFTYMNSFSIMRDMFDINYDAQGRVLQMDILFERIKR